jgi:hypothetical protein
MAPHHSRLLLPPRPHRFPPPLERPATNDIVIVLAGEHDRSCAQVPHDVDLAYRVHGAHERGRDGASRYAFEGECTARRSSLLTGWISDCVHVWVDEG